MPSPIQLCGFLWTLWLVVWLLWAFQSRRTRLREGIASQIAYRIPILIGVWLIFYARWFGSFWTAPVIPYHPWLGWLAIAITLFGLAFAIWARAYLGSNWSGAVTIKVGHELIRTGPYRLVRHPIYTGVILAMAGTALAYNQWRALAAVPLFWLAFTIKRLKEEQFMRLTFGPQYNDYARTTGAIFPLKLNLR
jgi:protein-S-isoprenylcysteine O-methyltransferase Ste14